MYILISFLIIILIIKVNVIFREIIIDYVQQLSSKQDNGKNAVLTFFSTAIINDTILLFKPNFP